MKPYSNKIIFLLIALLTVFHFGTYAQGDAKVSAKIDAAQIAVGDQVRLFLRAEHNPKLSRIEWAPLPDSFDHLEVVEKGKIDTIVQGDRVTYQQRLLVTGFDSGLFQVPVFTFAVIPNSGNPYTLTTDSFRISVQTVAVDTTKAFRPIKDIMQVQGSWLDYIWYIVGGVILLAVIIFVTIYFARRKKPEPVVDKGPKETLQQKTLRLLASLEQQQLWQKDKIKEYYIGLTDIVRTYVEERFQTPALELTTDELLYKARLLKELQPYQQLLATILHTADLAKFAKGQPLPQEHTNAMDLAIQFINASKPVETEIIQPQS